VRLELFDEVQAAVMRNWPHSELHVHTAVQVPVEDRAFATRRARYRARNHVGLGRLTNDRAAKGPIAPTTGRATHIGCRATVGADGGRPAALLLQIFVVNPLACPSCYAAMRLVDCITQTSVFDQLLTHLRTRAACRLSTAPAPRHRAGTFGVSDCPTGATDGPPPASLPPLTALPTALEEPARARRIVDPPRLQHLSRVAWQFPRVARGHRVARRY
jgi:hypothetical protein